MKTGFTKRMTADGAPPGVIDETEPQETAPQEQVAPEPPIPEKDTAVQVAVVGYTRWYIGETGSLLREVDGVRSEAVNHSGENGRRILAFFEDEGKVFRVMDVKNVRSDTGEVSFTLELVEVSFRAGNYVDDVYRKEYRRRGTAWGFSWFGASKTLICGGGEIIRVSASGFTDLSEE